MADQTYYINLDQVSEITYIPPVSVNYISVDAHTVSANYMFDLIEIGSDSFVRVFHTSAISDAPYVSVELTTSASAYNNAYISKRMYAIDDYIYFLSTGWKSQVTKIGQSFHFDGGLTLSSTFSASDITDFAGNIDITDIKYDGIRKIIYFLIDDLATSYPYDTQIKGFSAVNGNLVDVTTAYNTLSGRYDEIVGIRNDIIWVTSGTYLSPVDAFFKYRSPADAISLDSYSSPGIAFNDNSYCGSTTNDNLFFVGSLSAFAYSKSTSAIGLTASAQIPNINFSLFGYIDNGIVSYEFGRILSFSADTSNGTISAFNYRYIEKDYVTKRGIANNIGYQQANPTGSLYFFRTDLYNDGLTINDPLTLTEMNGIILYKYLNGDDPSGTFELKCLSGWNSGNISSYFSQINGITFSPGQNSPYVLLLGGYNNIGGDYGGTHSIIQGAIIFASNLGIRSYADLRNCYIYSDNILFVPSNLGSLRECTIEADTIEFADAVCSSELNLFLKNSVFVVPNTSAENMDYNQWYRFYISAYNCVFNGSTSANIFSANDYTTSAFIFSGIDLQSNTFDAGVPAIGFSSSKPVRSDYTYPTSLDGITADAPTVSVGLWGEDREGVGSYAFTPPGYIGSFYFGPAVTAVSEDLDSISLSALVLLPTVNSSSETVVDSPVLVMKLDVLQPTIFAFKLINVDFLGVPRLGSSPLEVDFTAIIRGSEFDDATYNITEYRWYFDYGRNPTVYETSTVPTITHTYTGYAGKLYDVRLCVVVE